MSGHAQDEAIASRNLLVSYIFVLFPLVVYASTKTVNFYAEPDFPNHTFLTLYVAFFCTFSMFMLIPIDISSSIRDRNAVAQKNTTSKYKDDTSILSTIYLCFYVVLLTWTNLVLAMQEYYNTDGYFTPGTRAKSSFRRWLTDTVPAAVVGLIVLGILIGSKEVPSSPTGLKIVLVCVTNAIYETMLMFLLGYGYVELPKMFWLQGNHEALLIRMQTKVSTDLAAFQASQLEVQKAAASCLKTKEKLGAGGEPQVQEAMSIMLAECPQEFRSSRSGEVAADKTGKVTIDTLAALRTRLNVTKASYRMSQARLENTQLGAYIAEDLVDAKNRNNRRHDKYDGQRVIHWQLRGCDSTGGEYRWQMEIRPKLCRIVAICLGLLSLLSIVGGVSSMHGVPKQSSLYFVLVHMPTGSRGSIAFFIILTFGYTIVVALWSLLQLRSLGFELVKGRTTPFSLSACFRMIASLAFPLTFFYLGWLGENGTESTGAWMYFSEPRNHTYPSFKHVTVDAGMYYTNETHYVPRFHHNVTVKVWHNATKVVAEPMLKWTLDMDYMPAAFAEFYVLPSATNYAFGTVYPVLLVVFLVLFITQAYNRLMVCLKMPSYQFGDPVVTKEQLDEGMKSLNKYRKIAQRTVQRQELARKRTEKDADRSIRLFGMLICKRETLKERADRLEKEQREADKRKRPASVGESNNLSDLGEDSLPVPEQLPAADMVHVNLPQPAHLTGTVHIRGKKPGTDKQGWISVYLEVRPPGILYILQDISCADVEPPALSPDLPAPVELISAINFHRSSKPDKEGRVAVRIDQADDSLRIRLDSNDEAEHWACRLGEWKDFSINYKQEREAIIEHRRREAEAKLDAEAHARFYKPQVHDIEEGSSGRSSSRMSLSLSGMSTKVFKAKEPMTINPMRLAGNAAARYDVTSRSAVFNTDVNLEIKPDTVEGWLEIKNFTKTWFGPKYKKYYFRIHEGTSSMQYFHDDVNVDDVSPVGFIDLRLASEALQSTKYKDARDQERFNFQVNALVYYFKAPHAPEAKLWIRLINLWREFLVLKYANRAASQLSASQKSKEDAALLTATATLTADSVTDSDGGAATTTSTKDEDAESDQHLPDVRLPPTVPTPKRLSTTAIPSPSTPSAIDQSANPSRGKLQGKLKVSPRRSQALSPALIQASNLAQVEMRQMAMTAKDDASEEEKEANSKRTPK